MENQRNNEQNINSMQPIQRKNKVGLPLIALGLDLFPILLAYLPAMFGGTLESFALLLMVLSPIAGLITGVASLSRRKGQKGLIEKIIAIISIVLPLSLVALVVVFFIGAATGIISFM